MSSLPNWTNEDKSRENAGSVQNLSTTIWHWPVLPELKPLTESELALNRAIDVHLKRIGGK